MIDVCEFSRLVRLHREYGARIDDPPGPIMTGRPGDEDLANFGFRHSFGGDADYAVYQFPGMILRIVRAKSFPEINVFDIYEFIDGTARFSVYYAVRPENRSRLIATSSNSDTLECAVRLALT